MIAIKGTRTKLHHVGEAWCRARTTYPLACPDGVTRCVTIANWRWGRWVPGYDPDAFTSGPFKRFVAAAWRYAQIFVRHYDASAVMAEELVHQIELHHRRPYYWPANDNPLPPMWDSVLRVPPPPRLPPAPWRKRSLSGFFYAASRVPPPFMRDA